MKWFKKQKAEETPKQEPQLIKLEVGARYLLRTLFDEWREWFRKENVRFMMRLPEPPDDDDEESFDPITPRTGTPNLIHN